jgi:hypothetical protein
MKHFFWIVILALNLFADNWNNVLDTTSITDTLTVGTVYYTAFTPQATSYKYFKDLGKKETFRLIAKVRDIVQAGFSGDSVNFELGYQLGTMTMDTACSSAVLDTSWEEILFVLDTFVVDSFGVGPHYARHSYLDVISMDEATSRAVDTTDVAGFATMQIYFTPQWNYLIRFWIKPLAGHAQGYANEIRFDFQGSLFSNVRGP